MTNYKWTKNWFNSSEVKHRILNYVTNNNQNNILEIGCYEGLSSVFWAFVSQKVIS